MIINIISLVISHNKLIIGFSNVNFSLFGFYLSLNQINKNTTLIRCLNLILLVTLGILIDNYDEYS